MMPFVEIFKSTILSLSVKPKSITREVNRLMMKAMAAQVVQRVHIPI